MDNTLEKISNLYSDNLSEHGDRSKAVGWSTPESQELRFEKLTEAAIIDKDKPISINDYGCGYGAHLDYLLSNGFNVKTYNGYDLSEEMLSKAKKRLASFKGELNLFQASELSTRADYTFVSGTFNVRFESNDKEWLEFIKQKLAMMNQFSSKGFSFNLLSKYVDWEEPHLFYGDPCFWFDFVKSNLARRVSLLHDYPLYEWTIVAREGLE
jgi:SAM-dependent methyltransferase